MPASEVSETLAEAIVSYGLTDASAWHINAGRISTNTGLLPQGRAPADRDWSNSYDLFATVAL